MSNTYTFVSPLAVFPDDVASGKPLASRTASLDGRRVALLPNYRPGAVEMLEAVGKLLRARFPSADIRMEPQSMDYKVPGAAFLKGLAGRTDAVVTAAGD